MIGPVHGSNIPRDIAVMAARRSRCIAVTTKNHAGAVIYAITLSSAYLHHDVCVMLGPSLFLLCFTSFTCFFSREVDFTEQIGTFSGVFWCCDLMRWWTACLRKNISAQTIGSAGKETINSNGPACCFLLPSGCRAMSEQFKAIAC
jgi:hypothetical protein